MEETTDDVATIDIELAKTLITTILSVILYGRQAFPQNCFREVSIRDLDHRRATHKHLLRTGPRLSLKNDPLHTLSPERQTLVYMRECDNRRLHGLLADMDQIFAALANRFVGKIYICFTGSKKWSKDSLLECYTLKFSYTELGDFHIYMDWTGTDDTPLKERISEDVFKSLKQVVLGCPQLPDPFYTHLFVSSVDNKTKLEGVWAGNGHGVREALLDFKGREGSSSVRVGRLSSSLTASATSSVTASASPEPNLAASPAGPISESNGSKEQRSPHKRSISRPRRQDPVDSASQPSTRSNPEERREEVFPTENLGLDGDNPTQAHTFPGSPLVEHPLRRRAKKRSASHGHSVPAARESGGKATISSKYPRLAMIEEIPEDLPPTQRLRTPSQSRQTQISTKVNPSFSFLD
ncbi:hypothetical protein FJTKL_00182 [Diaporthe vaccinii]|uniref:HORMA domain-containing protein n=1 Tax=Diaporthe vaccinii TaxID=105482 RepID=A0ABR4E421_9PEZI